MVESILVLPSDPKDAGQMAETMSAVYEVDWREADAQIFSPEQFRHQISLFPEGQFTAFHGERVVGVTVSMRMNFDPTNPFIEPWWETIGGGWLKHIPDGEWMYGVESHVHPDYQGRGVGGVMMEARFDTAKRLNMRGMVAGSTLLSYAFHADEATPEQYVRGVVEGRYFDQNLSKQMKKGFMPIAVIPNYVTDPTSLGWGAVIVWHNPDYDPSAGARASLPADTPPRRWALPLREARAVPVKSS
jgi:GNAT superfamily N-acetyltransferase